MALCVGFDQRRGGDIVRDRVVDTSVQKARGVGVDRIADRGFSGKSAYGDESAALSGFSCRRPLAQAARAGLADPLGMDVYAAPKVIS